MITEWLNAEDANWMEFLERVPHDFYHLPTYSSLCARTEGGVARAFYAKLGTAEMLVPVLIHSLPELLHAPPDWRDASSPYGYPSPLFSAGIDIEVGRKLLDAFRTSAADAGIVAAFFRLHPFLPLPEAILSDAGTLVRHGETVYVDLSLDESVIWDQMGRHRRDIRKLGRFGFRAIFDDWSRFPEFSRVYRETMQRVSAAEAYFFPDEYFSELRTALGGGLHLCIVESAEGDVAAAGLFAEVGGLVQYHLGGTHSAYTSLAPSKLMLHSVIDWARDRGNRVFHLGGGLGGAADSLFHFKAGFSPNRGEFYTYRMIINPDRYRWLQSARNHGSAVDHDVSFSNDGFFPAYRQEANKAS